MSSKVIYRKNCITSKILACFVRDLGKTEEHCKVCVYSIVFKNLFILRGQPVCHSCANLRSRCVAQLRKLSSPQEEALGFDIMCIFNYIYIIQVYSLGAWEAPLSPIVWAELPTSLYKGDNPPLSDSLSCE